VPKGQVNVVFSWSSGAMDLKVTKKTIKKVVVRFTCQELKHLINKRQGQVVFPGFLI